MNQVYKWVCSLGVLVKSEEGDRPEEVYFSITKSLPFEPQLGLDVEFCGMPNEAPLSQVCYVEEGNHFEVFMHIGDMANDIYYSNSAIKVLESRGWKRDK